MSEKKRLPGGKRFSFSVEKGGMVSHVVSSLSFCLRDSRCLHLRHPLFGGILQSPIRLQFRSALGAPDRVASSVGPAGVRAPISCRFHLALIQL